MSKQTSAKEALDDHRDLEDLLEILKNIATNRFYKKLADREDKSEIEYVIKDFFRIAYTSKESKEFFNFPEESKTAVLAFTTDGGFMGTMTAKVVNAVLEERSSRKIYEYIVIGRRGVEKIKPFTDDIITSFVNIREDSHYRTAVRIKDHIMKLIQDGKVRKVVAIYPYAQTLNLVKVATVELFPPAGLIEIGETSDETDVDDGESKSEAVKEAEKVVEEKKTGVEKVLFESSPVSILKSMAGIWFVFQITEMLAEAMIAGYATQSQQLENSMDAMTKEGKKLLMDFRKARRSDIDKSLREAFSNTLISSQG